VLAVHHQHNWPFIDEHMHISLGKESKQINNKHSALKCWMRLLVAIYQPPDVQQQYLSGFLSIAKELESTYAATDDSDGTILGLLLPNIDVENVYVHFDDHRCFAAGAYAQSGMVWDQLDERVTPAAVLSGSNWLESGPTDNTPDYLNLCGAQEEIGVDVEFTNVLQVTIQVNDVHLDCSYSPPSSSSSGIDISSLAPCTSDEVEVRHENFTLRPLEKTVIRLKVSVLKPGLIKVKGVKWVLCGVAHGAQRFDIRGPKRKMGGSSGVPDRDYPPHRRLIFQVLPKLPCLEAAFSDFPQNIYAGEVCKCSLTLRNKGAAPLHALRIVSTNDSLTFGGFTNPSQATDLLGGGFSSVSATCERGLWSLPESHTLEPGQEMRCPVWVHTDNVGHIRVHCAFYYQPTQSHPKMRFRILHCTQHVQVFPSIQLSGEVLLSEISTSQVVLHANIRNTNPHDTFGVKHLTEMSGKYRLNILQGPQGKMGPHGVSPNEQFSIFIEADALSEQESLEKSVDGLSLGEKTEFGLEPCVLQSLRQSLLLSPKVQGASGQQTGLPVLAVWQTVSRISGKTHLGVVGANFDLKQQQDAPMHMTVSCPERVMHDFSGQAICIVPCKVSVMNTSKQCINGTLRLDDQAVDGASWKTYHAEHNGVVVENTSSGGGVEYNELSGCLPYSWCGKLEHHFKSIKPGQSLDIVVSVAIFGSGIYEIDSYKLQWSFDDTNFSVSELQGQKFLLNIS